MLLASQDSQCAICRVRLTLKPQTAETAHVDHDHRTGEIRGVLCMRCNTALGYMLDDANRLRRAADYLDQGGRVCRACARGEA